MKIHEITQIESDNSARNADYRSSSSPFLCRRPFFPGFELKFQNSHSAVSSQSHNVDGQGYLACDNKP